VGGEYFYGINVVEEGQIILMAEYLLKAFPKLSFMLDRKETALFLDFDGTLSHITMYPDQAAVLPRARELLLRLVQLNNMHIAIVSGRALTDVRTRVGLAGITYVGNHGQEIEGPAVSFVVELSPDFIKAMREIVDSVSKLVKRFRGLIIEQKGSGVSIHFRMVAPDKLSSLRDSVRSILLPYLCANRIKARPGKMVLDIRPPDSSDKGKAVKWLLEQWAGDGFDKEVAAVYIGDDETDEDAFRVLPAPAITVRVGCCSNTTAAYYVNDVGEVLSVLEELLALNNEKA